MKVRIGRFGGEGTGGQSFYDYDWKNGSPYRFQVSANVKGERTEYSGYFFGTRESGAETSVTFSTVTGGKLLRGYYAFIEDFKRDRVSATKVRQARFANGWVRTKEGELDRAPQRPALPPILILPRTSTRLSMASTFVLATGETKNTGVKLREFLSLPADVKRTPPTDLPGPQHQDHGGRPRDCCVPTGGTAAAGRSGPKCRRIRQTRRATTTPWPRVAPTWSWACWSIPA